jgi:DNA-3-methyladenine glycosylase
VPLPLTFYLRPTLQVAPELLGLVLVHRTRAGKTSGMIVEVEAYIGESDPACHAAPGLTRRNAPLYGPAGYSYVYLNYGVHYLFNVVTEPVGSPAAILVRALEPIDGIPLMRRRRARMRTDRHQRRRPRPVDRDLCRGPGNLTHALGISLRENQRDLSGDALYIEDRGCRVQDICWSSRIGISKGTDKRWRCFVAGSASVSGSRLRP